MVIQWEKGRGRLLAVAAGLIAAAMQIAAALWLGGRHMKLYAALALPMGLFAFAAFGSRVTIRRGWGMLVELLCIAGASVLILHLPLHQWTVVTLRAYARGAGLAAALLGLVFAVTANMKWFGAFWLTFNLVFSIIDVAVIEFSGNAITASDIVAIGTAANVAGNYHFEILPLMLSQAALYIACMAMVLRSREERPRLKKLSVRLVALGCAAVMAVYPTYTVMTRQGKTWKDKGIRLNSVLVELLLEAKTIRVSPPEGYSPEAVTALSEKYPARAARVSGEKRPHVIAVMVEAFCDLSVLGAFETDVDYMPFTHRLMDESVSGTALASTFGGGTARSEWEFLTGNSMAFLPGSTMPFRQYMNGRDNSLVRVFENAGYHTIGMHPFKSNGWGRNKVYPGLGFDETYFIDDLDWGETVRGFVSDRALVRQIIRLYENRDAGRPLFLFGVTVQNHGGYDTPDYESTVHLKGMDRAYPAVEQYLSLIRETDDAIRELVEYFAAVDEPVIIVFFGDHQPNTRGSFRSAVGPQTSQQLYMVPFAMWDNYEHRAEHVEITSLNFLPARLLDLAGVQKPSFYCMLSEVNRTVDAMNPMGYYSGGVFHSYGDRDDAEAAALLRDYNIYQYANMFDGAADPALFIGAGAQ